MFPKIDLKEFENVKRQLEELKNIKLVFVAHKHIGDERKFFALLHHFHLELNEFEDALYIGDFNRLFFEIADLSNMLDFLFECLMKYQKRVNSHLPFFDINDKRLFVDE